MDEGPIAEVDTLAEASGERTTTFRRSDDGRDRGAASRAMSRPVEPNVDRMLDVRPLTADDLDAARGLSTQAGWNQIAADWRRFLRLSPTGCFAGVVDDEVVATTAVITYGTDVSWIGMVLVDERHRGQGYGSRIFERGLEYAEREGG